uniref:Uncharacterized protein n=1 Tax=Anguilla anguilla TaxID=7936 RepID=A0A0E9XN51_ANGAN
MRLMRVQSTAMQFLHALASLPEYSFSTPEHYFTSCF